jgi:hypothetical protein
MRPDQPAFQETRIRLPKKDATTMSGPEGPGDCHVIRYEGAQPGRLSGSGHPPRPLARTGTRTGTQPPRARAPEAQMIPTRSSPAYVPTAAKLLSKTRLKSTAQGTQCPPSGRAGLGSPNLMEHSTDSTDGKYFQISTRFAPCNKFGIYPLRTRTCYRREHIQALQAYAIFLQFVSLAFARPSQGRNSLRLIQALPVKSCRSLHPPGTFLPVGTALPF